MTMSSKIQGLFPFLDWGRQYNTQHLASDVTAAVIVTIMLIPQSLAYAMLAGLPPEVGLYASILPLVLYAVFGTSRTLAVGPVAVVSLMSAAAVGALVKQGSAGYLEASILLALLSGGSLLLMGVLRLGFLANFLSHPVISGFISASGVLIAISQFKHVLGVSVSGHNLVDLLGGLARQLPNANLYTVAIGLSSLAFLYFVRLRLKAVLLRLGVPEGVSGFIVKAGPVFAVAGTTIVTASMALDTKGVQIVGNVPVGLPALALPSIDLGLVHVAASASTPIRN